MLEEIFGLPKPIIGMVHLLRCNEHTHHLYDDERAEEDALALIRGGVNGICIENWDTEAKGPFLERAGKDFREVIDTARCTLHTLRKVPEGFPLGINVLHNDYRIAYLIARFGLKFVWLDVFTDRVRTDFEHTNVRPFEVVVDIEDVKGHKEEAGDIPLFVQVHPKHYKLIDEQGRELTPQEVDARWEDSAINAMAHGADAIVVTNATGVAPMVATVQRVKAAVGNLPVLVGSGVNPENVREFLAVANGAIVGTYFRTPDFSRVVEENVKRLMKVARR